MFFQDRKIKYSIRKLSVATVSLAIGFLFAPAALGVAQVAQADELSTTEQVENKAENQVSVVSFATEQEESETTYVDTTNKVTWTFAGYDKEKIVVGKGRQTFLGSWVPTPNPEYVFKSSKAGVPLPQSILGMLPKDEASYKVGDTIVAKQPAVESVVEEEKDYVWTFKGYDQKNATYNGKRVTFTGIWEVTPRPHHVSYTFVSVTSGVDLPKFIQKKAPKDGSTYFNRTRVFAEEPTTKTYIDSVNDGTWTFKGYDAASAVVNKANVEFVGKWTFEANKYQATYRFESATSDKALPAGIATLLPSDSATYENGNSVSAKQPAQATYIDSVNDGTWTFKGYDAASAVVNKANVEFVGKWEFKANPTNAETYTPQVTEETIKVGQTPDLTDNVTNLPNLPAGTKVVDITPAGQIDTTKPGTYTGKVRVDYPDGSSTEVSVSVNVLPAPETQTYKVTYRFESATSDKALPAGIATLLPSDSATYENGNSVSAKQPAQATYIDSVNDGTWTFKGYDAASAVVNKANVEFVGKWEFKVNPTNAETYTPQVTEETIKVGQTPDLTDNVTNLPNLPAGTKVVDITPAGQIDTTKPGTYTGKVRVDYPDGSSTEVSVSVNVLPAPETQTYKVTYRFESATADNNLPAEVLSLLPQSGTYTTSSSVAIAFVPEAPMPVEVAVANGTWTFLGYQEVEEGSNLTFVGKWVFEAKQDPSPQPQPAPTPQPAPQPNPVPPVNPGGEQGTDNNQADRHQSEQPRKPEENPPAQGPAGEKEKQATLPNAGSTAPLSLTGLVTSSLLAGLAVLLLGRKRKDD
ncbi:SHIRT domain-containing protein [Streptococcus pneumoniae]|uniref:SHIRT domain-containing protein n=12 Tax=Streptococcus pneumoniae TaxID=1313 RepID=UPI00023128CD|nr:SHIRT domain-containing protein [Streptococcus pneumoniae]EHE26117.1 LPXTG-motif cell wall anchor domain protein [Streptococcus pneumoniae GA41688]CAG5734296.1 LPXTG cell wall surface protein [Streptococcus pneumoniae]CAG5782479.1 LPXTG cell wall surface protein [Streptococcus pneumoniae]CAG5906866.1 fibril-like structure subunit FibA [Streptococcus pneumoniae]CVS09058.1 LPXTG cell wall surface protein [Streptococcus pneumoniae]